MIRWFSLLIAAGLTFAAPAAAQTAGDDAPLCDIEACDDRYRSFRASDCTFQPFDGPRRLCSIPPPAQEPVEIGEAHDAAPAPQPVDPSEIGAWSWLQIGALTTFGFYASFAIGRVFFGDMPLS